MWRVALLWSPFTRMHSGLLARVLPVARAASPRVLLAIALAGALVVVGPAALKSGGGVVEHGPVAARQLVTLVASRLAAEAEPTCQSQGWLPPALSNGDEGPALADMLWTEPGCDGW